VTDSRAIVFDLTRNVTRPPKSRDEISATEAAQRLGLTKQAVGIWCAKPGAPVRKDGTRVFVRWPDFARWREQELVAGAKRDVPAGTLLERRQAAEARSAEITMELHEITLAEKRGEVVAVADYEAALATILDRLTARLRAMPVRFGRFGGEVEAAAEAEVERVVTELSRWDEDVIDEDDVAPEGEGLAA
jgi:hypothetical protein